MLRIVTILSALCLLLLAGYVTMNKGKMAENKEAVSVTNTASTDKSNENLNEELKTANAAEKSILPVKEVVENTRKELDEIPNPFQETKSGERDAKPEETFLPEVNSPKMTDNNERENKSNNTSEKWATLEETQQVLDDTDKMLETIFTGRRTK